MIVEADVGSPVSLISFLWSFVTKSGWYISSVINV